MNAQRIKALLINCYNATDSQLFLSLQQVAFVNAVLDTAVKGHAVKASLLFDQEGSINEIDGNESAHNGTLYDHIARSKNTVSSFLSYMHDNMH